MEAEDITTRDCDYHRQIGDTLDWCDLSDNPCFVGMIDGDECDEFNELRNGGLSYEEIS